MQLGFDDLSGVDGRVSVWLPVVEKANRHKPSEFPPVPLKLGLLLLMLSSVTWVCLSYLKLANS